jgi:hypothetical protein
MQKGVILGYGNRSNAGMDTVTLVEIFCTTGGQSLLSMLWAQWKKTFLPTSNIIISQSV